MFCDFLCVFADVLLRIAAGSGLCEMGFVLCHNLYK